MGLLLPRVEYAGKLSDELSEGDPAGDDDGGSNAFLRPEWTGPRAGEAGAGEAVRDAFLDKASSALTREIPPMGRTVLRR